MEPCSDLDGPGLFSQDHTVSFFLPCRKGVGPSSLSPSPSAQSFLASSVNSGFGLRVFDLFSREESSMVRPGLEGEPPGSRAGKILSGSRV